MAEITRTAGSERRACRWLGVHRSAVRYVPDHRDDAALRTRLSDLADAYPRWGLPRLIWKLRQAGVHDNHKRVQRLYRMEGLKVRRQCRRRTGTAEPRVALPARPGRTSNGRWISCGTRWPMAAPFARSPPDDHLLEHDISRRSLHSSRHRGRSSRTLLCIRRRVKYVVQLQKSASHSTREAPILDPVLVSHGR
ncbi:MAG: IS3 family transposase [Gemmatimonadaceae bacterium]